MIGVGAAFDFRAGTLRRAPAWMRDHGLKWLHRLLNEPGWLWKWYLATNTLFMFGVARQLPGKWDSSGKPRLTYHIWYIHNVACGKLKNTDGWINSFPVLFP